MKLAVFPLPIFLLPGGVTRLRIFETRYIRMVKEAVQGEGFALSLFQPEKPFETASWGNWVNIIDFATLPDGLLSIDVQSQRLVSFTDLTQDDERLRYAHCTELQHWSPTTMTATTEQLAKQLEIIFAQNPNFSDLYKQKQMANPTWVYARLLELLPLPYEQKQSFIEPFSFDYAQQFLATLLLGKQ